MSLRPNWTTKGMTLEEALKRAACTASGNAKVPLGQDTLNPLPLIGPPLSLLFFAALVANGLRVLLLRHCVGGGRFAPFLTRAWL